MNELAQQRPPFLLPPGPRGRLRTTWQIMRNPYAWYHRMRDEWGGTFGAQAINGDLLVTGDPQLVRRIFALTEEDVRPFASRAMEKVLGPHSVLLQFGEPHKRTRSVLLPAFTGERMKACGARIRAITREEADRWCGRDPVSLQEGMLTISLRVIVETVFGARTADEIAELTVATTRIVDRMNPAFLFSPALQVSAWGLTPWDRFLRARRVFVDTILRGIERRRAEGADANDDDILGVLLKTRDEHGELLTDEELVQHLIALLVAGHETTSIALSWAMDWLHRAPDTLAAVRADIDAAAHDGDVEGSDVEALQRVVRETLRLWPIVPDVLRTLRKPLELGEYSLPAGLSLAASPALTHYDPTLYPDPFAFRPDRFLTFQPRPWEYYPFGGGVRRCIGASFATHEMAQVLAALLLSYRFDLQDPTPPRPERRSVTMAPRGGVPARCSRR